MGTAACFVIILHVHLVLVLVQFEKCLKMSIHINPNNIKNIPSTRPENKSKPSKTVYRPLTLKEPEIAIGFRSKDGRQLYYCPFCKVKRGLAATKHHQERCEKNENYRKQREIEKSRRKRKKVARIYEQKRDGVVTFVCELCGMFSARKFNMEAHLKTCHSTELNDLANFSPDSMDIFDTNNTVSNTDVDDVPQSSDYQQNTNIKSNQSIELITENVYSNDISSSKCERSGAVGKFILS